MASVARDAKSSRFDMRMSADNRKEIERAASLKGMSLSQWALQALMAAARHDIQEETVTRLSAKAFDDFKCALDEGMPTQATELLTSKPVWE